MNIPDILARYYRGKQYGFGGDRTDYNGLQWQDPSPCPSLTDLQAYAVKDAQAIKLGLLSDLTSARILSQWPLTAQIDVALGLNDSLSPDDPYSPANLKAGMAAVLIASRAAAAAINALTDEASVQSYQIVIP
jgi:hypothetical protein